jgi:hypothetical protein
VEAEAEKEGGPPDHSAPQLAEAAATGPMEEMVVGSVAATAEAEAEAEASAKLGKTIILNNIVSTDKHNKLITTQQTKPKRTHNKLTSHNDDNPAEHAAE